MGEPSEWTMFRELQDAVSRKPVANGLAIIVACEHGMKADHKHLPGARKDLDTMKYTFERLKFTAVPVLNPSKDELIKVIQAAVSIQYPNVPDQTAYGRLVFYFSGHGDGTSIYTHDGAVNLHEEVYPPFLPQKSPHLAKVSKFFFLDTCRGSGTDEGVRIQQFRARGGGDDGERTTSAGNYLLACSTLPTKKSFENLNGGFWTQELAWQICLLENFDMSVHDVLGKVNKKLIDKMQRAGFKSLQQPVLESTLIGDPVKLLKEAVYIENHPEKGCYFTDPACLLHVQLKQQPTGLPPSQMLPVQDFGMANNHQGSVWPNMLPQQVELEGVNTSEQAFIENFAATPRPVNETVGLSLVPPAQYHGTYQHPHGQYSQHSGMTMQNGETRMMLSDSANVCSGNSTFLHAAATPASHHDLQQQGHGGATSYAPSLSPNVPQPIGQDYQRYPSDPQGTGPTQFAMRQSQAMGYQKQHSEPTITKHRIPSQASLQGGNEQGYYRGLLNHFQQTGIITDYHDHDFIEKHESNRILYQSYLSLKHVATQRKILGTSRYLSSKGAAKEDAARDAFEQIDALTKGQKGRGSESTLRDSNTGKHTGPGSMVKEPPSSASPQSRKKESPTAKIWKQRLKEHLEKKLKKNPNINYKHKENPKTGRFTATVYCPVIGMEEGEKECPSKSAAEHSAAYNALKTLGALP